MARPQRCRRICAIPEAEEFIPRNSLPGTTCITLSLDEYEVIRLIDFEGLTQEQCARQIHVARTTVTTIYEKARYKLARTLVKNQKLHIAGGAVEICPHTATCTVPYCHDAGNHTKGDVSYE